MKLKKLLAFGLALVMCLAMAACGTNPDEKPEESTSQTDAEPVLNHCHRELGLFCRLLSCHHAYGIQHLWCRILES